MHRCHGASGAPVFDCWYSFANSWKVASQSASVANVRPILFGPSPTQSVAGRSSRIPSGVLFVSGECKMGNLGHTCIGVLSLVVVAVGGGACRRQQRPPPVQSIVAHRPGVTWTPQQQKVVDCALSFAKRERFFQAGSIVTVVGGEGNLWMAHFATPGTPPNVRGFNFEVRVELPACKLVNVLVFQ